MWILLLSQAVSYRPIESQHCRRYTGVFTTSASGLSTWRAHISLRRSYATTISELRLCGISITEVSPWYSPITATQRSFVVLCVRTGSLSLGRIRQRSLTEYRLKDFVEK